MHGNTLCTDTCITTSSFTNISTLYITDSLYPIHMELCTITPSRGFWMTLLVGHYLSYSLGWVLEPPSSSSPLPPLKQWMITAGYCSLGTFSTSFSKTTQPTTMYTTSSMATSTTSHSHSSLCGTKSWVPTCHTRWRRGKVVVLKLDLAKITRMINFFAWWAFFICTSIVFPCYEQLLLSLVMPVYIHLMCPVRYFCFPYVHTR